MILIRKMEHSIENIKNHLLQEFPNDLDVFDRSQANKLSLYRLYNHLIEILADFRPQ